MFNITVANTFNPCHTINLIYPAQNEFARSDEFAAKWGAFVQWHMIEPSDVSSRRRPTCLVPSSCVRKTTSPYNEGEISFFYSFEATQPGTLQKPKEFAIFTDIVSFIQDVQIAKRFVGSSEMLIDVVKVKASENEAEEILHLEWNCQIPGTDDQGFTIQKRLIAPFQPIYFEPAVTSEPWFLEINELIHRSTDRAEAAAVLLSGGQSTECRPGFCALPWATRVLFRQVLEPRKGGRSSGESE